MIVALIGPHGAGKTTLGALLAARLGVRFDAEIGRELADDPAWRATDDTASDAQPRFDREVLARELARDARSTGASRVVETWHPGNLAFAGRRSPDVVGPALGAILERCAGHDAVVVPITAPLDVLARRATERADAAFFHEVGRDAIRWAHALGLRVLPPVTSHGVAPEALANALAARLRAPNPHLGA